MVQRDRYGDYWGVSGNCVFDGDGGLPVTVKHPSLARIETARPRTITAASWTFKCDARAAATTRQARSIGQIRAESSLLYQSRPRLRRCERRLILASSDSTYRSRALGCPVEQL